MGIEGHLEPGLVYGGVFTGVTVLGTEQAVLREYLGDYGFGMASCGVLHGIEGASGEHDGSTKDVMPGAVILEVIHIYIG